MRKFYFDTGVKSYQSSYMEPGDIRNIHGSRMVPFECDGVPAHAKFMFLTDNKALPGFEYCLVVEIHNTTLLSKYAYFDTRKFERNEKI